MKIIKRIKLMIISETTAGGVGKHLIDLLNRLDKNKYEITFIFSLVRADESFLSNLDILEKQSIKLHQLS